MFWLSQGEMVLGLIVLIVVLSIALGAVQEELRRREGDGQPLPQPEPQKPATDEPRGLQTTSEFLPVDGDGGTLHGQRVRLLGFDAPESWRPEGVSAKELAMALAAKARLTDLAREGLRLHFNGQRCKYGRLLARAETLDGRDVAGIMISEGHARPYGGGRRLPWV